MATRVDEAATYVRERFNSDLRRLGHACASEVRAAEEALTGIPGIGEVGAAVFLREVQAVWDWVGPYFDERAIEAARSLDLPASPAQLQQLAGACGCARPQRLRVKGNQ